jgi:hypothetical protein
MTVCIAAICTWDPNQLMIVGASDRMVSAEDIAFQQPQTKAYSFFPWVMALLAGDPYAQISICNAAAKQFAARAPQFVEDVAIAYAEAFSAYRRRRAETKHLKPLGLDANSFMDRQQDFRPDFVSDLTHRLERSPIEVETLIVGVDPLGAHIYIVTDPGDVSCADAVGFAAIGTGKAHADSQFMLARYTRYMPWQRALLLSYIAKKRAEVAPTVGDSTDLFFIGGGGFQHVSDAIHTEIQSIYGALETRIQQETEAAGQVAHEFLDAHLQEQQNASGRPVAREAPTLLEDKPPTARATRKRGPKKTAEPSQPEEPDGTTSEGDGEA